MAGLAKRTRASAQWSTQHQLEFSLNPKVQGLPFSIIYTSHSFLHPSQCNLNSITSVSIQNPDTLQCFLMLFLMQRGGMARQPSIHSRDVLAVCSKGVSKWSSFLMPMREDKTASESLLTASPLSPRPGMTHCQAIKCTDECPHCYERTGERWRLGKDIWKVGEEE